MAYHHQRARLPMGPPKAGCVPLKPALFVISLLLPYFFLLPLILESTARFSPKAMQELREAETYLADGDVDQAMAHYRLAAKSRPGFTLVWAFNHGDQRKIYAHQLFSHAPSPTTMPRSTDTPTPTKTPRPLNRTQEKTFSSYPAPAAPYPAPSGVRESYPSP